MQRLRDWDQSKDEKTIYIDFSRKPVELSVLAWNVNLHHIAGFGVGEKYVLHAPRAVRAHLLPIQDARNQSKALECRGE